MIAIGYFIGAALMIAGGVAEAFLGVKAEGQSLESIAQPLTAADAEEEGGGGRSGRGVAAARRQVATRCLRRTASTA